MFVRKKVAFRKVSLALLSTSVMLVAMAVPAAASGPGTTGIPTLGFWYESGGGQFYGTVNTVGWTTQNIELFWDYYAPDGTQFSYHGECEGSTSCSRALNLSILNDCSYNGKWTVQALAYGSVSGYSNLASKTININFSPCSAVSTG